MYRLIIIKGKMKIKEALIVNLYVFFILFCSCKQEIIKTNEIQILGEWQPVEEAGEEHSMLCYNFMEDGVCDYYPGFFSYHEPQVMVFDAMHCIENNRELPDFLRRGTALDNVKQFYGNRTTYQKTGDTLKIFDPSTSVWNEQKILYLSPDSMVLSYINECQEEIHVTFGRLSSPEIPESPPIDRLIFFYPDRFNNTDKIFSIQRNGVFMSTGYQTQNELLIGRLEEEVFEHIEKQFKRVDFSQIKPCYSYLAQDFAPKIAIIRGNEMLIIPAMTVNPIYRDFYRAYIPTQFFQDITCIYPIAVSEYMKNDYHSILFPFCEFIINEPNKFVWKIESLYLRQLLLAAEKTSFEFEPKYRFQNSRIKIETDGRYFRFTEVINVSTTLDIGINFIEDINRIYVETGSMVIE